MCFQDFANNFWNTEVILAKFHYLPVEFHAGTEKSLWDFWPPLL